MQIESILNALVSHAMTTGWFDQVNQHEPKNAPGNGITAGIWVNGYRPVPASGLTSTTGMLTFTFRLYQSFLSEPEDQIDIQMVLACDDLIGLYHGDFTLGGLVRNVDVLGEFGNGLSFDSGYLAIGNKNYRIIDIHIPLVVNDLWVQAP